MGGPHDGKMVPYQGRDLRLPWRPIEQALVPFMANEPIEFVSMAHTDDRYRHQEFGHSRLRLHEERYVHNSLTDAQALERMCAEWGVPE
jgi:hypothetical protein